MYRTICTVLFILLRVFTKKVKVMNKNLLPKDTRYIVTCTHTSMIEIIVLAMAVYPHEIHYMAKQELLKNKLLNWFFRSVNAFPVNRENPGPSTLKMPVKLLNEGKTVGMFPSGSRTQGAPVKRGAATISVLSKAPIIPAAFVGSTNFKNFIFSKEKSFIKFGTPIDPKIYLEQHKKGVAINEITIALEHSMNQLSNELIEIRK